MVKICMIQQTKELQQVFFIQLKIFFSFIKSKNDLDYKEQNLLNKEKYKEYIINEEANYNLIFKEKGEWTFIEEKNLNDKYDEDEVIDACK